MAYETFKRSLVRVEEPTLSFVPDGRIVLNAAASRTLAAAGVKSVLLLWDKVNSKIAIKAAPKHDKNSYTISFSHDGHAASMRAKLFFGYIGWSATRREMLPAIWDAEERMLEATLPRQFIGSVLPKGREPKAKPGV